MKVTLAALAAAAAILVAALSAVPATADDAPTPKPTTTVSQTPDPIYTTNDSWWGN